MKNVLLVLILVLFVGCVNEKPTPQAQVLFPGTEGIFACNVGYYAATLESPKNEVKASDVVHGHGLAPNVFEEVPKIAEELSNHSASSVPDPEPVPELKPEETVVPAAPAPKPKVDRMVQVQFCDQRTGRCYWKWVPESSLKK